MSARAYRVAPRGRAGGRPASRIQWDRVGRMALVVVFFVILALYVGPTINFVNAWRQSHAQEAALVQLKRQNAELHARTQVLSNADAAERAARRQGMVQAGELPYSIRSPRR